MKDGEYDLIAQNIVCYILAEIAEAERCASYVVQYHHPHETLNQCCFSVVTGVVVEAVTLVSNVHFYVHLKL